MTKQIYDSDSALLERLLVRATERRMGDYFCDRTLLDAFPCLKPIGTKAISKPIRSLVRKGIMKVALPLDHFDKRVRGMLCLSSRITDSQLKALWEQVRYRPTPYQLHQAAEGKLELHLD